MSICLGNGQLKRVMATFFFWNICLALRNDTIGILKIDPFEFFSFFFGDGFQRGQGEDANFETIFFDDFVGHDGFFCEGFPVVRSIMFPARSGGLFFL